MRRSRRFSPLLVLIGLALAGGLIAQTYASLNYMEQGGARWVIGGSLDVASGGDLDIESGAAVKLAGTAISATAAELNSGADGIGNSLSFVAAAGGANVSEITVTVKDGSAGTVAAVHHFDLWLSDAATCAGLTGATASGAVAAKAASGVDLSTYTAKKALRIQTLATGVYILSITDSAKTGFYVCGAAPGTGKAVASTQLVTGSYG
jgi:hypothetical protein